MDLYFQKLTGNRGYIRDKKAEVMIEVVSNPNTISRDDFYDICRACAAGPEALDCLFEVCVAFRTGTKEEQTRAMAWAVELLKSTEG